MPRNRRSTGGVLERLRKDGTRTFALRFKVDVERDGRVVRERQFVNLGSEADGWTRERADRELEETLVLVERGFWRPPERSRAPAIPAPKAEPTFHEYASEWFARREAEGLAEKSRVELRWSLSSHLLPFFRDHLLSEITVREIEAYKLAKLAEREALKAEQAAWLAADPKERGPRPRRPLSNSTINRMLRVLGRILEAAVDEELIGKNPVSAKRHLKAEKPSRPWVEPEQLPSLLDAALDEEGRAGVGRVLLGLLAGTGVRIGEALDLVWGDLDLGTGTLHVRRSKTAAGVRSVDLSAALREELALWRADARFTAPSDPVVHTSRGRKTSPSNVRRDVLRPAVAAANARLEALGIAPIASNLGLHGLRRTYATLARLNGEDLDYVGDQLGHTDPSFTLRVYRQTPRSRRDRLAPTHRKEYDRALEWAQIGGSEWPLTGTTGTAGENAEAASSAEKTKTPR
jgi:integrase